MQREGAFRPVSGDKLSKSFSEADVERPKPAKRHGRRSSVDFHVESQQVSLLTIIIVSYLIWYVATQVLSLLPDAGITRSRGNSTDELQRPGSVPSSPGLKRATSLPSCPELENASYSDQPTQGHCDLLVTPLRGL